MNKDIAKTWKRNSRSVSYSENCRSVRGRNVNCELDVYKRQGEALAFIKGNPLRIAGWFAVLMLLAVLVGKLIKWEPMISGSGIPQVEGEILGKLNQNWLKVLPAKFAGGFLCLFGGCLLYTSRCV